ncbi:MAG: metal ABC transporter permease, partial [Planctomycetota bacterium]
LLTGALAAAACAIPGTFLLLRGMSLIGDAISHAVLPGIVVAFLVTGKVTTWPVVLGAGATGLGTVWLIESLRRTRRVKEDASIAVVFPALFALGVLLIARFAGQTDLDQECVLYGEIAYAPLDRMVLGGVEVVRPAFVLGAVALLNLVLVSVLYKELELVTFDTAYAAAAGLSPVLVHYLLMGSVSVTTVASFESVGAILVVAFLIVPAATAYLLTDRLWVMLLLAVAVGVVCATVGYRVAQKLDSSIAGCMAAALGAAFVLAWLLSPRTGILARLVRERRLRRRYESALLVEHLARAPAPAGALARELHWPADRTAALVRRLRCRGLVTERGELLHPTAAGLTFARTTVG